jgi:HSP20 family molecular chaperone IbpA
VPRVDIHESAADVLITADIPGVPESGVRLEVHGDELVLEASGPLSGPAAAGEGHAALGEVEYRRVFRVPKGIDADHITAELKDGVLRLRLPRTAAAQPRKIEVRGH